MVVRGSHVSVAIVWTLLASTFSMMMIAVPEEASAYTSTSPIYIYDNLGFNAGNGVVSGSGTEIDPYIIEGWEIVTTGYGYGILVANTDMYFTIRDCYIHGVNWDGSDGVHFINVKYGTVENCTVAEVHRGVNLGTSSYLSLIECNISGCGYGIYSDSTNDVNVSRCTIQDNSIGFSQQASASMNCTFSDNVITGNSAGILVFPAHNFTFRENLVSANYGNGVYLGDSDECYLYGNLFEGNLAPGLSLGSSTNMTLSSNLFVSDGMTIGGEDLTHWTSHDIGLDNLVNGLPVLYLKDSDSVVLDGGPAGTLILANCTEARVTNLTIGSTYASIIAGFSDGILVENCTLMDERVGVSLNHCPNAVIKGNTIINATFDEYRSLSTNVGLGISANSCQWLQVIDNEIIHPDFGIYVYMCPGPTIEGNSITIGNYAGGISGWQCDDATLLANEISFKDTGISWWDSCNVTLLENAISNMVNDATYFDSITGLTIASNDFVDNGFGLRLSAIDGVSLVGNYVSGTFCTYSPTFDWPCLQLRDSQNIELTGNTISGNENGLYMYNCDSIEIVGNDFSLGENEGIYLEYCFGTSISLNNVSSNGVNGIHLRSCGGVQSVTYNLVYDNPVGISLDQSGPEVVENVVIENGVGMELLSANGVTAYHNDFIANTIQATASNTLLSTWNDTYPSGGNYWSDYSGTDELRGPDQDVPGPDGIGDMPYILDFAQDQYPFMYPLCLDAPPSASVMANTTSGFVGTPFEFDASLTYDREDPVDTIQIRWDWDGDGVWDTGWSTEKVAEHQYEATGEYEVVLEAMDSQNQTDLATVTVEVQSTDQDDETPSVEVSIGGTEGNDGWFVSPVAITVAAIDSGSGIDLTECMVDGSFDWTEYGDPLEFDSDGTWVLEVRATDLAGNTAQDSASFKIDCTAPQTSHSVNGSIVTLVAEDGTSGVLETWYRVDGGEWQLYDEPFEVLGEGEHDVEYRSVDVAGNEEEARSINVETTSTSTTLDLDWWMVLLVGLIIIGISVGAIYGMRRKAKEADARSAIKDMPSPVSQLMDETARPDDQPSGEVETGPSDKGG